MKRSPRQRWGTCCPYDPECDHSFISDAELARVMDTPISDAEAHVIECGVLDCADCAAAVSP